MAMSAEAIDIRTHRGHSAQNLSGLRFGHLLVIRREPELSSSGDVLWRCVCDCGESKPVRASFLRAQRPDGQAPACGRWCPARAVVAATTNHSVHP